MPKYQVAMIPYLAGWEPASPDAVPPSPGKPTGILAEADELLVAVRQAIEFNQSAQREASGTWAVVVEPGRFGRTWPGARLCTPLAYKVAAVWWPGGWEPQSPWDVPNCVWKAQGDYDQTPLSYQQALATIRGLNQQAMDHAAPMWYAIVAVESEPVSRTVSYDPSGTETTVEVRPMHLVRPDEGGRGDCSHCPAHSFSCPQGQWLAAEETIAGGRSRSLEPTH